MAICKTLQANGKFHITTSDYILNLEFSKLGVKAKLCMICAYLHDASLELSSLFAPMMTILPEVKIRAVVLGS
ncbi:hypothetical protein BDR06DRAFT_1072240 [Suillus hirtellus]|nr:hypothetical protein BDR06DRAFT_1072240 [Suillus hirtellus]